MNKRSLLALTGLLSLVLMSASVFPMQGRSPSDAQAIRDVIQTHYVEGLWKKRDKDVLAAGMAENFVMNVYWKGKLSTRTGKEWLARMKPNRAPNEKKVEAEIRVLDITGVAAVARVDLHEAGKHLYTDYFGLYKTDAGWRLTSKTFHAH